MATTPKTPAEVETEIKALEACKAYVPRRTAFGDDNHHNIDLQIEFLKGDIDTTADDEWEEYTDDEQSVIMEAQGWKEGQISESPSSGWDGFKPKTKGKK